VTMQPCAYFFALRVKDSTGTVKAACRPSQAGLSLGSKVSGGTFFSYGVTIGPPKCEPVILERETLAFGLRNVVIGYRVRVPVEFLATGTTIQCDSGADPGGYGADLSNLSNVLAKIVIAGYYYEVTLNGNNNPPTWYRCELEEFTQETLDPERFVGMRMRFLFAKADLNTTSSGMNAWTTATW